jgi:hypothetical protein
VIDLLQAAAALAVVYASGYVTGALLVAPATDRTSLSLALVRLVSGLLLSSIGFLLSLVLSLPWATGPIGLITLAAVIHRRAALALPRPALTFTPDGALAALAAALVVAPVFMASLRMAPGDSPPVFFNVDVPYFLEKVHALVRTDTYPPESLGVAGGRPAYHLGVHGVAALISRASGLAPHQATFLLVLPLLACASVAAAVLLWRALAPAFPAWLALPLVLTAVPSLWYPFWLIVGPALAAAVRAGSLEPLAPLFGNFEPWGVVSMTGQNLGAQFLVVAALGAIAAVPARGWRLPVFLVGTAVLFKAPTGVALAAGFALLQAVRATQMRSLRPLVPLAAAAAVFAATYGAFWILPGNPIEYRTELFPLFHLRNLQEQGRLTAFGADLAWLLLPALVLLPAAVGHGASRTLPLLFCAAAPLVVANSLRAIDLRPGRGIDYDWLQVMMPMPLLVRAFVIAIAAQAWMHVGGAARAVFVAAVLLAVVPSLVQAARYAGVLVANPAQGHEFVDNRAIAEALRAIPVEKTLVVTNDLRYPAEGYARDHRQLQIPALFGHQAFAVNYTYEEYSFSRERLALQNLLRAETWTAAIEDAALRYGWTHLLIRKDYAHPQRIPIVRIFDNDQYSVFRFQ